MATVKIKRNVDGKATEMEIEESEIQDGDERLSGTQPNQDEEKKFSQADLNRLLAQDRRAATVKFNTLQGTYDALLKEVEDGKVAAETAAKEKATKLREGLPESVTKLLDKLTYSEQLEWLSDPANRQDKKKIPPLPPAHKGNGKEPSLGMARIKF